MAELDPLSVAVGEFKSAMRTLFKRADEDREIQARRHDANQQRLGELSQSTALAISELRQTASDHWDKTQDKIEGLSRKLDEHAATVAANAVTVAAMQPTVAAVNAWRAKLAAWGSVAFFILIILGWAAEAAIKAAFAWAVAKIG